MKKFFRLSLFFAFIFLISCSSSSFRAPGESRIILKNIASEYYAIAEGFFEIKKYDKAAEYYRLAMRNDELYLSSYYKLARSYALAKDWDKASEAYNYLLKLDPENTALKASLAYITAMSGDFKKGIALYKDLISENSFDESLLESYLALLINAEEGKEASETYFVLKEKFPNNKKLVSFAQKLTEFVKDFNAECEKTSDSVPKN